VSFDDLRKAVGIEPRDLYIFQSHSAPIESSNHVIGGFSFPVNKELSIYGFQQDGTVQALGLVIRVSQQKADINEVVATLQKIQGIADVQVVDWYQGIAVPLDSAQSIAAWLDRQK
jgi:hypothetical protein